jgi:hypothetical protein
VRTDSSGGRVEIEKRSEMTEFSLLLVHGFGLGIRMGNLIRIRRTDEKHTVNNKQVENCENQKCVIGGQAARMLSDIHIIQQRAGSNSISLTLTNQTAFDHKDTRSQGHRKASI